MLSISAPVDAGIDGVANVDRIAVHSTVMVIVFILVVVVVTIIAYSSICGDSYESISDILWLPISHQTALIITSCSGCASCLTMSFIK